MNNIVFEHVVKAYGKNVIVNNLNMEIREGERLILLGPSGCGKSTTLRMIAGLEDITSGSLHMRGQVVNNVACGDRGVSMVFQNYALFPHMTVKNNIIYGLKAHKMEASEINRRLEEVLEMLQLKGLEDRKPKDLSGGQRQRVALARAVVKRSDYFLLDEPLSNLDAQLRLRARKELVKIHEMYRPTMVYVTHDQTEAMTLGTKIVVMKDGMIQQVDTPKNIYNHPVNKFVAGFVGSPSMNFIECEVAEELGKTVLFFGTKGLVKKVYPTGQNEEVLRGNYMRKRVILGIRSEDIYALEEAEKKGLLKNSIGIKETVINGEMLGAEIMLYFEEQDRTCAVRLDPSNQTKVWEEIDLYFDMEKIHIFDIDTEENILYRGR